MSSVQRLRGLPRLCLLHRVNGLRLLLINKRHGTDDSLAFSIMIHRLKIWSLLYPALLVVLDVCYLQRTSFCSVSNSNSVDKAHLYSVVKVVL